MMMVSQRLRTLRRSRKLSQIELAARAQVSQSYLSRLEKGVLANPSAEVVQRLADALSVPVALLYTDPGEEALALRGDLQARVEAAVEAAGENPEAALRGANEALVEFLSDPGVPETGEIADWGRRFIEGRISLLRFSLLERHGMDMPLPVAVVGALTGEPGEEIGSIPRGEIRIAPRQAALRVGREGLVPGAGPGDFLLFVPGEDPGNGGLAILRRKDRRYVRKVFDAPGGQVLLIPPGSRSDPSLPPGNYPREEIRIEGRVCGLQFGGSGRATPVE
jgi:transcriptional regulator with XRE-family HTH domain